MAEVVPASEFTRDFGRYRAMAQRGAVAVSSDGTIAGYFIAPDEYEAFERFKRSERSEGGRRSFSTADLTDAEVAAIAESRMDERHAHLDALLDAD